MSATRRARRARNTRQAEDLTRAVSRPPRERFLTLALAAVILAAGAWAWSNSFAGVFVLDDVRAIVRNATIRTLWPLSIPLSPPSGSTVAGRPVANLSFAVSYAMGAAPAPDGGASTPAMLAAPDATPFHAGNLVIHLATALVLFGVVRRTLLSPRLRERFGAAAPWMACAVALLWVVHPLHTSAVTYAVQRVESLMGLFYLLTLYCAIRAGDGPRRRWWAAASVVSCAAGMGTKETMVTAPVMVALWDWTFREPAGGRTGRVRWTLVAGLGTTWLLLAFVVTRQFRAPSIDLAPMTIWLYVRTQAEVIAHYVRLAFYPSPLVFLYDWPLMPAPIWQAWQAALLVGLAGFTVAGIVKRHPLAFLGAWFFLILAPSSSVLPIITEVAAEHRMYLPLAAVATAIVLGAHLAVTRLAGRWTRATAGAAVVAMLITAGALGTLTYTRNAVYASAEGLWADTVAKRPEDARPRVAFAEALARAGRLPEAETQLWRAVELAPDDPVARVRLGSVLAQRSRHEQAATQLNAALALRPGDVDAHRFLGEIYALQRRDGLALEHYSKVLAGVPDDPQIMARMAAIRLDSQDPSVRNPLRAKELAEQAARLTGGRDPRILEVLSAARAAADRTVR